MKTIDNVIFFDNDDEFSDFCLLPYTELHETENGAYIGVAKPSEQYLQAVEQGKIFVIRDKGSKALKRMSITKRVAVKGTEHTHPVQMKVKNLQWYSALYRTIYAVNEAHEHSAHNRSEIERSRQCGCFNCNRIFNASEVVDYIDNDETALCPHCSFNSVIGDASGIEITTRFLEMMNKYWFK